MLPAGQSTVVWAKSSHEKNDPPASLLWKKHEVYWVGVNCIVRVLSADGELLSETILAEEEEVGIDAFIPHINSHCFSPS